MIDKNCIFCKIANHYINSPIVYEDDEVVAFLDAAPMTAGHTLVVSKQHYDNFLSTPRDLMNKMMNVAQRIGQIFMKDYKATGINIIANSGVSAGQSVNHFHIHVIPRYIIGDGFSIERVLSDDLDKLNLPVLASQIKNSLS